MTAAPVAVTLALAGEMTIGRAAELKQSILTSLDRASGSAAGGALHLDLGGVTELDTAGVQLLLLARALADARACALRLTACSVPARAVLALLNLGAVLDVPPPPAAAAGQEGR